jgi:hypothetical protein
VAKKWSYYDHMLYIDKVISLTVYQIDFISIIKQIINNIRQIIKVNIKTKTKSYKNNRSNGLLDAHIHGQ